MTKITDSTDKCPYCGYADNQCFTYDVFERRYKTNVCRRCSKAFTVEIKKEETKDDK